MRRRLLSFGETYFDKFPIKGWISIFNTALQQNMYPKYCRVIPYEEVTIKRTL